MITNNKSIILIQFAQRCIDYFNNEFGRTPQAFYKFFDCDEFPDACRGLGFEMDCGDSFVEAYGKEAWRSSVGLAAVIDTVDDVSLVGSGLFSKWRYFNHWADSHGTDDDKEWFLLLLHRLKEIAER